MVMSRAPRGRRISDQAIEQLRQNILAGIPWRQPEKAKAGEEAGYADLVFLVTGLYYPITDFIHGKDDAEAIITLWSELREDVLQQHAKLKKPGKPWAWSHLEDR